MGQHCLTTSFLHRATELDLNPKFHPINIGDPLVELSDEVLKDMSTDQVYGWRIVQDIRSDNLTMDLGLLEIGPVNHARWLTTANRICRIWISNHGLKGKSLNNLRSLVEYIIWVNKTP